MDSLYLYKSKKINKSQLLLFYIIKENNPVSINDLIGEFKDLFSLENLSLLESVGLINIDYQKNLINLNEKKLNSSDIDKIRVVLNREIKTYELEKIKQWFEKYSIEEIQEAVYQTVLKGIDNFNYIEKVLFNDEKKNFNDDKKANLSGQKVIKKFDLFE